MEEKMEDLLSPDLLSEDLEDLDQSDLGDIEDLEEDKNKEEIKVKKPINKKILFSIVGAISILVFVITLYLPKLMKTIVKKGNKKTQTTEVISTEKSVIEEGNINNFNVITEVEKPKEEPIVVEERPFVEEQPQVVQPQPQVQPAQPLPERPEVYQKREIAKPTRSSANVSGGSGARNYNANNQNNNNNNNQQNDNNETQVSSMSQPSYNGNSSTNRIRQPKDLRADNKNLFVLQAGTYIPIAIQTEMDSDKSSNFIAIVRENVYSRDGSHKLLIPMGSRVIGVYEELRENTQDRIIMFVERIILPNQETILFDQASIMDLKGKIGTRGELNQKLVARTFNSILALGFNAIEVSLNYKQLKLAQKTAQENLKKKSNDAVKVNETLKTADSILQNLESTYNDATDRVVNAWRKPKNKIIVPIGSRLNVFVYNDFLVREYKERRF